MSVYVFVSAPSIFFVLLFPCASVCLNVFVCACARACV